MKKITYTIILILITSASLLCREHKGFANFNMYRPVGEFRLWTFILKDTVVGSLTSKIINEKSIDGEDGFIIEEILALDFTKTSRSLKMDYENKFYVSSSGNFLGIELSVKNNERKDGIELFRDGNNLAGVSKRGDRETKETIPWPRDYFALESNFLDMFELYWAARDFKVGDVIEDSIFVPGSLNFNMIHAQITSFEYRSLYNTLYDSVFVITYAKPLEQVHYFTPDNRLVKAIIPSQDLKVYLDAVRQPSLSPQQQSSKDLKIVSIYKLVVPFMVYLVFGLMSLVFFIKQGYRWLITYIGLLVGGLIYFILPFTHIPLHDLIITKIFLPKLNEGGSEFIWGLLPAIFTGIFQETLKAAALILFFKVVDLKKYKYQIIGAVIGLGFGLAESGYIAALSGSSNLIHIGLLERGFNILFHTTAGALLGYGLSKNIKMFLVMLLLSVSVNSILSYLPLFVQFSNVTIELLVIIIGLAAVTYLLAAIYLLKKSSD